MQTEARIRAQIGKEKAAHNQDANLTSSKKKRLRSLGRTAEQINLSLREDNERDLGDIRLDRASSSATKQTVYAKVGKLSRVVPDL